MSDSPELLKPDTVTDNKLHIELGNLNAENQRLQTDYTHLLESSTVVTNKLRQELAEVRSQLATERADREGLEGELFGLKEKSATADKLPDAGDLLNRLLAKYQQMKAEGKKPKKPTASVADIEGILEMIEEP